MSSSAERDSWVLRVLGVAVTSRSVLSSRAAKPEPFQIFVKNEDNVTFTLTLSNGPATTLGELQVMIEARTGLPLDGRNLTIGAKSFKTADANIPVSEFGLQRNQTLFLHGALKGGFGERAAMEDAILRNIRHGNVLGDIEESAGATTARVKFGRRLLDPEDSLGQNFLATLFKTLKGDGLLPDRVSSEAELKDWMKTNEIFLSAISSSCLQAGNCSEYADVAYASLLSNTKDQIIYRASMVNGCDHGFAITCPTMHSDIESLCTDPQAMVVDPWWNSTICTLKAFVDGENPYKEPVDPSKNLKIRLAAEAKSEPPLSKDFERVMSNVIGEFFEQHKHALEYEANEEKKRAERLVNTSKKVRELAARVEELEEDVGRASRLGQQEQARILLADYQAKFDELLATKIELQEATKAMPGMFGESGVIWNRTKIRDLREDEVIQRIFGQAHQRGKPQQLEAEMDTATDEEFLAFTVNQKNWMLHSEILGVRFQSTSRELSNEGFLKACGNMDPADFAQYVQGDLLERYLFETYKISAEEQQRLARGRDDRW
jgi:hypothetical protein